MKQQILILGAGFAGMWAALSAARLADLHGRHDIEITVLAPSLSCASAHVSMSPRWKTTPLHCCHYSQ